MFRKWYFDKLIMYMPSNISYSINQYDMHLLLAYQMLQRAYATVRLFVNQTLSTNILYCFIITRYLKLQNILALCKILFL